jgi:hypothetical protein
MMSVSLVFQGAFALAAFVALVVWLRAADGRRKILAQAVFGALIAVSTLTSALSSHERAKAEVADKVALLDDMAAMEPSNIQREGRALAIDGIERALRSGLGPGPVLLLVLGGSLLGMSVAQLLWRTRDPARSPE